MDSALRHRRIQAVHHEGGSNQIVTFQAVGNIQNPAVGHKGTNPELHFGQIRVILTPVAQQGYQWHRFSLPFRTHSVPTLPPCPAVRNGANLQIYIFSGTKNQEARNPRWPTPRETTNPTEILTFAHRWTQGARLIGPRLHRIVISPAPHRPEPHDGRHVPRTDLFF